MNAERLHAIVIAVQEEISDSGLMRQMQTLVNSLRQLVQQSNGSTQQNLANALQGVRSALTDVPSDKFSPAWRQLLAEIGGDNLVGKNLKRDIEETISQNQITLAVALDQIEARRTELERFYEALNHVSSAFDQLQIGNQDLDPGESEIGILIPRKAIKSELAGFMEELKEFSFIIDTFSEVALGAPEILQIRTISSSDLLIYLNSHLPLAACLSVAIERIVALYKQVLEIRKLHSELKANGVPDDKITPIQDHANGLVGSGIDREAANIVNEFYTGRDGGRKNELITKTKVAMNKIANRIDRGFNIEVRVRALVPKEEETGDAAELVSKIQAATGNMQFMNLEGDPILQLPEKADAAAAGASPQTSSSPKKRK